jgi:ribosomal protein S18 acetylase RimI-like enzyme
MGIGNQLMDVFYSQIDRTLYSDVFIRVWEENKTALRLYEKSGYKPIATIIQPKIAIDGFSQYNMKKVYLHKRID